MNVRQGRAMMAPFGAGFMAAWAIAEALWGSVGVPCHITHHVSRPARRQLGPTLSRPPTGRIVHATGPGATVETVSLSVFRPVCLQP